MAQQQQNFSELPNMVDGAVFNYGQQITVMCISAENPVSCRNNLGSWKANVTVVSPLREVATVTCFSRNNNNHIPPALLSKDSFLQDLGNNSYGPKVITIRTAQKSNYYGQPCLKSTINNINDINGNLDGVVAQQFVAGDNPVRNTPLFQLRTF